MCTCEVIVADIEGIVLVSPLLHSDCSSVLACKRTTLSVFYEVKLVVMLCAE